MRKIKANLKQGQALVVLIVFVSIATIIISSAVVVAIINSRLGADTTLSEQAYFAAEAGANEAILALLRSPSYSGGTLSLGDSIATITVSGNPTLTIVSSGENNGFVRKVQVTGTYSGNSFAISSWSEIN